MQLGWRCGQAGDEYCVGCDFASIIDRLGCPKLRPWHSCDGRTDWNLQDAVWTDQSTNLTFLPACQTYRLFQ